MVTFGTKVKHERGFINYRALEVSVRNIDKLIPAETENSRRMKLFKIRKSINKILNEV